MGPASRPDVVQSSAEDTERSDEPLEAYSIRTARAPRARRKRMLRTAGRAAAKSEQTISASATAAKVSPSGAGGHTEGAVAIGESAPRMDQSSVRDVQQDRLSTGDNRRDERATGIGQS